MAIISEQTRISILAKKAAKECDERKKKIQQIMAASRCDVFGAIEIYKTRFVKGQPSDELIADLEIIEGELMQDENVIA